MSRAAVVAVFMMTAAAGASVPVCMAVSEDDAKTILGPAARRMKDPSGCVWEAAANSKKQMNIVRVGVGSMFESARRDGAKKGATKDEKGLGGPAFSTIPAAHQGARAAVYMLKDSVVLIVDIEGFGPGGAEARLPQVRDLVRKLGPSLAKE